jgi:hypothetical protein
MSVVRAIYWLLSCLAGPALGAGPAPPLASKPLDVLDVGAPSRPRVKAAIACARQNTECSDAKSEGS